MFRQTGLTPSTEPNTAYPGYPGTLRGRGEGQDSSLGSHGLPSFLSPAPPRSEGEALLRRIFSRGEGV
jgi:hypothetical protein